MDFRTVVLVSLAITTEFVSCRKIDLDRYIFEVTSNCDSLRKDRPVLNILTDYNIQAIARCANGNQRFTSTDGVHYSLQATFKPGNKRCRFISRGSTYVVDVALMYGEMKAKFLRPDKIYTISCTFDRNGRQASKQHPVVQRLSASGEIQVNTGSKVASAAITLSVQNINNANTKGVLLVSNYVTLYGRSSGRYKEAGIRATSCDAIQAKKKRAYRILNAGCGDGEILPANQGFITKGRTSRSPFFKPFYIDGEMVVSFKCNFTLCATNCDGSSCNT